MVYVVVIGNSLTNDGLMGNAIGKGDWVGGEIVYLYSSLVRKSSWFLFYFVAVTEHYVIEWSH